MSDKPNQPHLITLLERLCDDVEHFVHGARGVGLGQARVGRDRGHEIVLIHLIPPMKSGTF